MDRQQQYDSWHERQSDSELSLEGPRHPWHMTVTRLLPNLDDQRVLEIGCGRGDFAIWLSEKYPRAEIVGVDFSEVAIATAQRRADDRGSRTKFQVDNSEALSFADGSFDYVISCECLEHVRQPLKMASEIH